MLLAHLIALAQRASRGSLACEPTRPACRRSPPDLLDAFVAAAITQAVSTTAATAEQLETAAEVLRHAHESLFQAWNRLVAARCQEPLADGEDRTPPPSLQNVRFLLPRLAVTEFTAVIVQARVDDEGLNDPTAFLAALRQVVTQWVNRTQDGRDAFREFGDTLNIDDLGNHTDRPSLQMLLKQVGIHRLEIDVCSQVPLRGWTFDTPIVPTTEIQPTVTCSICHQPTPAAQAHLHQGDWIGEECWEERLRPSQ